MKRSVTLVTCSVLGSCALALWVWNTPIGAEEPSQPVYRVANDSGATRTPSALPTASSENGPTLDFTAKPGEHPLAPVVRVLKDTQQYMDANVRDYSCNFIKRERVDGELSDNQYIFMKIMHQPFSVYMAFQKPYAGREVAYVAGQNEGKMVVLEAGVKRILGKMNLDPQGSLAMNGQKRPITDVGIRNLTAKLVKLWEADMQYEECEVTINPNTKINQRPTTMVQITHPVPRQNFNAYIARIFIDNELKIPIHYDSYRWPEKAGEQPLLEESYTYSNLKLNNNFTAADFDAHNNPAIFKQ